MAPVPEGHSEAVTDLVHVPRTPDPPAERSDAELVVAAALGVLGASVRAGVTMVRVTAQSPVIRSAWRPPFVPARAQPASLIADVARRGARHRVWAAQEAERLLDQWMSVIVEVVVSRLDLTGIVIRHVDLDAVIKEVDVVALVDEVMATIDLPAIIRDSTSSVASETVRSARMTGISADEAISRSIERHLFRRRRSPTTLEAP